jgi:hypothetical protein
VGPGGQTGPGGVKAGPVAWTDHGSAPERAHDAARAASARDATSRQPANKARPQVRTGGGGTRTGSTMRQGCSPVARASGARWRAAARRRAAAAEREAAGGGKGGTSEEEERVVHARAIGRGLTGGGGMRRPAGGRGGGGGGRLGFREKGNGGV